MAHNVVFNSIKEIDLSKLEFPQVAVFSKPEEFPDKEVARVFDNAKATNMIIVSNDLTELVKDIRDNTTLKWFWRGKEDAPTLVGVFL